MCIFFAGASMTEAQTQTEQPPWETIWAILQETDRIQKENALWLEDWKKENARQQESYARQQEKNTRQQEEHAQWRKEWEQKSAKELEETKRLVKETSRQMGLLHNSFGEMAEHMVSPSIKEKFNALGYNFDKISKNIEIKGKEDITSRAEVDILLENGDIAIAVEVKTKPAYKDLDRHVERMEILRRRADRHQDRRKFRGAIAGVIMSDEIKRAILQAGFYLIEQTGDTVAINVPDSFVPREW
jgi:hypothetical protein